ncbi:MAG: amidohydrolase family protein [Chitinophagaceae bacterium]|nr:amidohydrolase family protein [Oligoflexus sp.]
MKWLKFKAAYVEGAWVSPFFIQVDDEGMINATSATSPQGKCEEQDVYLLPGIPNGHSHSFQYVMSGLSERVLPGRTNDDFWFWREQMYKLANHIELDELLSVTTQLYMGMMEQGYTSVTEFHYLHHDHAGKGFARATQVAEVIMEAAQQAGLHLTLVPVYYNQAAPKVPIKPQQKRFYFASPDNYLSFIEQTVAVANANYTDVLVGYGVHSLRAAPLDDIKTILSTPWTKGPAHFHASEQTADVDSFVAAYKVRPIDWLADNVPLSSHHNLVHATHLTPQESKKLVKSGATVVLCPSTEANLGDGIFPIVDYQANGGSWCIGSDSQVNLSPFREMQMPELTQRLLDRKRNVFCNETQLDSGTILYDQALKGGRLAVGLPKTSFAAGSLLEGLRVNPYHDRLLERPLSSVLSIMIYAPETNMIEGVYCKGSVRVSGGRHVGRSGNQEAYMRATKRLMQALATL